eukprot:160314-Chlamydomonas_euryale.AAC.2
MQLTSELLYKPKDHQRADARGAKLLRRLLACCSCHSNATVAVMGPVAILGTDTRTVLLYDVAVMGPVAILGTDTRAVLLYDVLCRY